MTDRHADWRTALDAFDTSAQIHGWAADMGTEKQALQARRDYERDKAIVCAAVLAVVAERDALRVALEDELIWHEAQDKAISKQPNANTGHTWWRRMQHQEHAVVIRAALGQGQEEA